MAIVFDTKAELEAFCEAFELRSIPQERPIRKSRHPFSRSERLSERHAHQTEASVESHPQRDVAPAGQIFEMDPTPNLPEEASVVLASVS